MSPTAIHERERKQEVRPSARIERLSRNTPVISPVERGTGGRGLRGLGGRGAFLGRQTELDDSRSVEGTRDAGANTPVYDSSTSWFGPLKVILSAVYASYKVRLSITFPKFFFDRLVHRKPFPLGARPKTSYLVYVNWRNTLITSQVT